MKKIVIKSHYFKNYHDDCTNGDEFDSMLTLLDDRDMELFCCKCNVDSSLNRKDGKVEIVNGFYDGVVMKLHVLNMCIAITQQGSGLLQSYFPNPRHDNKYLCSEIFLHGALGIDNDASEGCITVKAEYYYKLFSFLSIGERIQINKN